MPIGREVGVLRRKRPMHFGTGIDGVGHRLELRQQAVAKTFHQDAAPARQYFDGCNTEEIGPSTNGVCLVFPHEAYRFDEVDQQHDGLLPHELDACTSNVGSLGLGVSLLASVDSIIAHVDPTARLRLCNLRWYASASREGGRATRSRHLLG